MQYTTDHLTFSPSDLVDYMDGDFAAWMERWYTECRNGNKAVSNELGLPLGGMLNGVACVPDEQEAELKLIAAKGQEFEAAYGGKLNRTSLRHCMCMLQLLLPNFLLAWVEGGADQDWGPMCYPPLNSPPRATTSNGSPRKVPE